MSLPQALPQSSNLLWVIPNTRLWRLFLPFIIGGILLLLTDILIAVTPLDDFFNTQIGRDLQIKTQALNNSTVFKHVDTLFLGTSRTLYGFAAPAFNQQSHYFHSYNLGLAGSDLSIHRLLLEDYIQKYGKPKVVMVEFSEFQLGRGDMSPNSLNFLARHTAKHPQALMELLKSDNLTENDKKELLKSVVSHIYRYKGVLDFRRLAKRLLHPAPIEPLEEGWIASNQERQYMKDPQALPLSAANRFMTLMRNRQPTSRPAIIELIQECQNQGIPVVLVSWPLHPVYQQELNQRALGLYVIKERKALAQQYKVPYVNFDAEAANAVYFNDIDHLNREGAIHYTQLLEERLKRLGL